MYCLSISHQSCIVCPYLINETYILNTYILIYNYRYQKSASSKYSDPNLPPWMHESPGHRSMTTAAPSDPSHSFSLHILMSSFDGHVYVVDGKSLCFDRVDLGEHVYSTPVVDDLTGDGFLDIVVGSASGQLFAIGLYILMCAYYI